MHFGPADRLLWTVTEPELTRALRRCRRRLYAVAGALVAIPVVVSLLVMAVR